MNYNNILSFFKMVLTFKTNNETFYNTKLFTNIDYKELYDVFQEHAILPLAAAFIRYVPEQNIGEWKKSVYSNIYTYSQLTKLQEWVLDRFKYNRIPVVVVKGTSVAKYYPMPQLRTMGDIDLLVKPEDYEASVCCLLAIGCEEITSQAELELGRHRSFRCKDISIELHRFFSLYVDEDKGMALDNLLFNAITLDKTELPDVENGIVILSHIRQHLEDGIGLRQIIDWMMFVKSCLNDQLWYKSFQKKAQKTGLEPLAITVTKMCQIYLGLEKENITWCENTDIDLCEKLMCYILKCGNFGRNRDLLQCESVSKLPTAAHPILLFKYIQAHGEKNWKALKKYSWLKPFAWAYQAFKYIKMAVQNNIGARELKSIHDEGQKRNEMFAKLGI